MRRTSTTWWSAYMAGTPITTDGISPRVHEPVSVEVWVSSPCDLARRGTGPSGHARHFVARLPNEGSGQTGPNGPYRVPELPYRIRDPSRTEAWPQPLGRPPGRPVRATGRGSVSRATDPLPIVGPRRGAIDLGALRPAGARVRRNRNRRIDPGRPDPGLQTWRPEDPHVRTALTAFDSRCSVGAQVHAGGRSALPSGLKEADMTMTPRERVLAAIAREEPDRVPIVLGGSNATGIKMRPYRELKRSLGIEAADEYLYRWPELGTAQVDEETLVRLHSDVRGVLDLEPAWVLERNANRQPHDDYINSWGSGASEVGPDDWFPSVCPMASATTLAEIEDYPWPDMDDPTRIAHVAAEAARLAEEDRYAIM